MNYRTAVMVRTSNKLRVIDEILVPHQQILLANSNLLHASNTFVLFEAKTICLKHLLRLVQGCKNEMHRINEHVFGEAYHTLNLMYSVNLVKHATKQLKGVAFNMNVTHFAEFFFDVRVNQ